MPNNDLEIRNTCSTHSAAGENNTSTYFTQCTMYCSCKNILTATHILGFLAITPHMCPPRSQLTELLLQCSLKSIRGQRPAPARTAPPCHHRGRGVANRVGKGAWTGHEGERKHNISLQTPLLRSVQNSFAFNRRNTFNSRSLSTPPL